MAAKPKFWACSEHQGSVTWDGDLAKCDVCGKTNHDHVVVGERVLIPAIVIADNGNRGLAVTIPNNHMPVYSCSPSMGMTFGISIDRVIVLTNQYLLNKCKALEQENEKLKKEAFARSEQAELAR